MARAQRKQNPIHSTRNEYNALVERILGIPVHDRSVAQKGCIEKYAIAPVSSGVACGICGLNDMERAVIINWYQSAIDDLTGALTKD